MVLLLRDRIKLELAIQHPNQPQPLEANGSQVVVEESKHQSVERVQLSVQNSLSRFPTDKRNSILNTDTKMKRKTRPDHPAFAMRARYLSSQSNSQEVVSKKFLCRLINQIYVSRAAEFKEYSDEITITMVEWLYEFIYNKYGFAKVADKKFLEVLSGCT
jgi:hypothetical protein